MKDFLNALYAEFETHTNIDIAVQQKNYLRHQFEFYGIKTPNRRTIQKPFLIKTFLPKKEKLEELVKILWNKPQREYHYFTQELVQKYIKQFEEKDIVLLEFMITTNSWWDTVDFIATKLVKAYFKKFPNQRDLYIDKWLASNNIWLQRSCLLFQLLEKEKTDCILLKNIIISLLGSDEFFINKAIGWVLRDYSRTNPEWVTTFVRQTHLNPLSKREALRLIQ